MTGPLDWVTDALDHLEAEGLRRRLRHRGERTGAIVDGRRSFASNDYLDLAGDPRVAEAAAEAAHRWGAGSGASRLITGGTVLHRELEQHIAAWKGTQDAVVFSSGYLANAGTIPALVGRSDAVFSDELNHASIVDGCRLSGAAVRVYPHNDVAALEQALAEVPAHRRLVVTDGVFSMDGDAADVGALAAVARRHGAMLMVDDAHGAGVIGPDGRGTAAAQGAEADVDVAVGTLSKAFGAAGGYVAGRHDLCEWLRNRARGFVFDTAPPPPAVGAALAGLRISLAEPWRRHQATAAARDLADRLGVAPPAACVVPLLVGSADRAVALAAQLAGSGIDVTAIRPPSVPPDTSRLRFTTTAAHTADDVDRVAGAVAAALGAIA
ncbi:MAG TPA: 8-amino-7-oxononanoate synthase [Egibacteraceae bacterium]|nr:8-amino-7-oxononanoate synthase [Egibacteraceae bacterium]